MSKALVLALLCTMAFIPISSAVNPQAAQFTCGTDSWNNPTTGEHGACIRSPTAAAAFHCPWESGSSVATYGCDAIEYSCGPAAGGTDIGGLLNWYALAAKHANGVVMADIND